MSVETRQGLVLRRTSWMDDPHLETREGKKKDSLSFSLSLFSSFFLFISLSLAADSFGEFSEDYD